MEDMTGINFDVLKGMEIPEITTKGIQFTENTIDKLQENALKTVTELKEFEELVAPKDEEGNPIEQEDTSEEGKTEEEPKDEDTSAIKIMADWAKSQELIDFDPEKFEDKEDWLKAQIQETIKKGIEDGLNKYPKVIKELADNYKDGVPLDYLIDSKSREIEYQSITPESIEKDKELQKKLVSDWLVASDPEITQEEIDKKLQKYEDAVLLEDEAGTAHKKLIKYEQKYQENLKAEAKRVQETQKIEYETRIKNIEKEVMGLEEIIPGAPKTSVEERKKIFEAYTKVDSKGKTELIKAIEADPLAWYKITQLMVPMKGSLASVQTKLKTEASRKVKESVQKASDKENSFNGIPLNKLRDAINKMKK